MTTKEYDELLRTAKPPCCECGEPLGFDEGEGSPRDCPHCGAHIGWASPLGPVYGVTRSLRFYWTPVKRKGA